MPIPTPKNPIFHPSTKKPQPFEDKCFANIFRFIELIIDQLTARSFMEPAAFYDILSTASTKAKPMNYSQANPT
jgi:hypothetical protein